MSAPINFPDVGVPIVDPKTGRLAMVWFQLLLALFNRGGGTSGDSSADLAKAIAELMQQAAAIVPTSYEPDLSRRIEDIGAAISALAISTREAEPDSLVPTHGIQDAPDLHALATSGAHGFMSSGDKAKLDAMTAAVEDVFAAGSGFSAGTTTALTLSKAYASAAAVTVHFDGVFQGSDQYTISGHTITFTSAIPIGTQTVYARG